MDILNQTLFKGIDKKDAEDFIKSSFVNRKTFEKETFILTSGNFASSLGIILSGKIYIINEDFWGNRTIISEIGTGDIFAESYACIPDEPLSVSAVAAEKTEILFLDVRTVISAQAPSCKVQAAIIKNLLTILAKKNILLTRKMEHISKRTTREKLLSYLSSQSVKYNSSSFVIPFNRQPLADYLSVDRSAMSNELCKLRDEGLLSFNKNHFELKQ